MASGWLAQEAFFYVLLFARMGAAMMTLPGLSANMVSMRARLLLGLTLTAVVMPVLRELVEKTKESAAYYVRQGEQRLCLAYWF